MTALPTIAHDPAGLVGNEALVAFSNAGDPAVQRFLDEHRHLLPLLARAAPVVRHHFGPDTRLSLAVDRIPEAGAYEELYVVVHTRLSPDDALDRLVAFDDDWWLDELPAARGKLTITLAAE